MITVDHLNLTYPDGTVGLREVDLRINPGEIVYITGESGSGKTSLLKLLMGMEFPTSGNVRVLDTPITAQNKKAIRVLRKSIGPVFQEFKLIKGRTVTENILTGLRFLKIPGKEMKERTAQILETVGLSAKANTPVENLSYGQIQRIVVARALTRRPKLILADEPTGNLDHENALLIMNLLTAYRSPETTVLITTHATHLLQELEQGRHLTIDNGSITERPAVGVLRPPLPEVHSKEGEVHE